MMTDDSRVALQRAVWSATVGSELDTAYALGQVDPDDLPAAVRSLRSTLILAEQFADAAAHRASARRG